MNLINQLFFAVLISSVTSTLLFIAWRMLRGFFMATNARLIYDMLHWISIMYILPIGYAAVLFAYRGWFDGHIRLWRVVFARTRNITSGLRIFAFWWFVIVSILIILYILGSIRWYLIMQDNIPEIDPMMVSVFKRVCKKLDIPEGRLELHRNVLVYSPLIIGIKHPKVLLPEHDYTEQELELIFFHELSHHKHGDLKFKILVIIALLINCYNPAAYILFRTVNLWSECMADLAALEATGNLHNAKPYFDKIMQLIPDGKKTKRDSFFISTLSKDGKQLARRMDFMLKYVKTKPSGKTATTALAAAFVMMSVTTAYASGATVADIHNLIYQNTEEQINETDVVSAMSDAALANEAEPLDIQNIADEQAPGTAVVTEDGTVEYYCNVKDLDWDNIEIISSPDEGIATVEAGKVYPIDWTVRSNTRYVSGDYKVQAGGNIDASVVIRPSDKKCWLGIMNDTGTARYVEGTGILSHTFKITETCRYRVFVQNNFTDGTTLYANGSFIYEN